MSLMPDDPDNCQLIAAAPDLLEALYDLLKACDLAYSNAYIRNPTEADIVFRPFEPQRIKARIAVEKATGESA